MSECVVRMEMPMNCFECPFSIIDYTADGAWCNALAQQVYRDRDEDCPILCQLPEGHGRLVDADALLEQHKPSVFTKVTDFTEGQRSVVANIKNAPTIVPAERSET